MPIVSKQKQAPPPKPPSDEGGIWGKVMSVGDINTGLKLCAYGRGKCLGLGTPVLMYNGSIKPVEEIEQGEVIMGWDSNPRTVLSIAQGKGQLYRIVPTKGDSWVCNDEHILTLIGNLSCNKHTVRDVSVNDFLEQREREVPLCNNWQLFRRAVDFQPLPTPLKVPPYLVGLWMGDGHRSGASLTNSNPTIRDYCLKAAEQMGLKCLIRPEDNTFAIEFSAHGHWQGQPGRNPLRTFFREECISGSGDCKKIPHQYLVASKRERMELLAGIIDTDAESTGTSCTNVNVTGEEYRDGLLFLCRSLGFAAYQGRTRVHVTANSRVRTYYSITISGDLDKLPTKVRKFAPRRQDKRVTVTGFEIEDMGQGDYYGFTLDGDGRFLLGDFTVTHNTGKTRLACTFPKPLLLMGTEDGTKSVRTVAGVDYVRITDANQLSELVEGLPGRGYKTAVLDHAGAYQDLVLKDILGLADVPVTKSYGLAKQQEWGLVGTQFKERLTKLFQLADNDGINIVVIAHERNFVSDEVSSDVMMPSIGAALTPTCAGWLNTACDYVCNTFIREETKAVQQKIGEMTQTVQAKTGRKEFCLRIGPHPIFQTGFRLPPGQELPELIVNADYAKIVALINGKAGAK